MTPRAFRIFRIVLSFWLFGWFCKAPEFAHIFFDAANHPLEYALFPAILRHPSVAIAGYVAPLGAVSAVFLPSRALARGASIALASLAFFLCLHLETCNDATFVTSFWAAVWLVWWAWNGHREDDAFGIHGRALAQSIIGMIFLGGFIGKLTEEYWDGQAFFRLYFQHNPAFPYSWLRSNLSPETFRSVATWFSRCAIGAELVLATAPLLPTRVMFCCIFITLSTMLLVRTLLLASVLSPLLGLATAALLLETPSLE